MKLPPGLINISLILDDRYLIKFSQYTPAWIIYLNSTNQNLFFFSFNPVNEECIAKYITKLKNKSSYGFDNIPNKLITSAGHINVLVKPLTVVVNQSLHTGLYPFQLKLSRVKPLFKNGNKTYFNNYVPISLLPP